jgi:hypothetical protein
MTSDQIRNALKAQPFRAFNINLTDGRAFHVSHPEWVMLTPSGRVAVVAQAEGDSVEIIDVLMITSLSLGAASPRRRKAG